MYAPLMLPDGGMPYTETDIGHFFPEPLNAITSCFFLGIAIYWTCKLKGQASRHSFLFYALILLYIGGIGGMVYHGLRRWHFFILMDWLPIMILCVSAGVYFLLKLVRWYYAIGLICTFFIFQVIARWHLSMHTVQLYLNINYAVMAAMVLFPVLAYLVKTGYRNGAWVAWALVSFVAALIFRVADPEKWLPEGTHFLWHTFGAVAAFCMFRYIYLVNEPQMQKA